jgi:hypothetical protein
MLPLSEGRAGEAREPSTMMLFLPPSPEQIASHSSHDFPFLLFFSTIFSVSSSHFSELGQFNFDEFGR